MNIKARLIDKKEEAINTKSYRFKPSEKFKYKPGQYAVFDLGSDGKPFAKPFSLVDPPDTGIIRITTKLTGSDYKKKLDALNEGDEVKILGPMGNFVLEDEKNEKVCFLSGGIGVTPVKSIVESLVNAETHPEITLFYSNRAKEQVTFKEEFDALSDKLEKFDVVYTLTDAKDQGVSDKDFETGYINAEMIKKNRADYKECRFYISGPPRFNDAMKNMLIGELALREDDIVTEGFLGY